MRKAGYRTEAVRYGWSFVFRNHLVGQVGQAVSPANVLSGTPWWVRVGRRGLVAPRLRSS